MGRSRAPRRRRLLPGESLAGRSPRGWRAPCRLRRRPPQRRRRPPACRWRSPARWWRSPSGLWRRRTPARLRRSPGRRRRAPTRRRRAPSRLCRWRACRRICQERSKGRRRGRQLALAGTGIRDPAAVRRRIAAAFEPHVSLRRVLGLRPVALTVSGCDAGRSSHASGPDAVATATLRSDCTTAWRRQPADGAIAAEGSDMQ
jgi:hypothetical protein